MTTWAVSIADTFLNELLNLPQNVSKKVSKAVKILEQDPLSAQGDAKKLKGYKNNIYRVRIGNYRLFYSFGQGWVKLLSIRKRDERTYEIEVPLFEKPTPPPKNAILEPQVAKALNDKLVEEKQQEFHHPTSNLTSDLPLKFTDSLLKKWQIPEEYWSDILQVQNSEAILDLPIPDKYISRILDNCFPRSLEEIEQAPEYLLKNPSDLERFVEGDLSAFLLKLDPEQEKLRDFGSKGPILIKGGPGTGKSTLALYRVEKLLDLGFKNILFTTYTNALVTYSQQLLEQLLGEPPQKVGVEVTTIDSLIYQYYVKAYGRTGFAKEEECKHFLTIALTTANIPAKNVFDQQVRRCTIEKLGLSYLLQEILEVIESRGIENLEEYQKVARTGRGLPLKANIREAIWAVYQTWKGLMEKNKKLTWEQLRRKALASLAQSSFNPPYQAILIDEAQDLSPVALRFLLSLVPSFEGVYLTADASQSLYQKGFSWKQIHTALNVTGRTLILKRNYRNTQQISAACAQILAGTKAGDKDCLHQHPSPHQGERPIFLTENDREREIDRIRDFLLAAAKKYRLPLHGSAVLCPNSQTAKQYAKKLTESGLNAKFVWGKKIDLKAPQIKVMTLYSAKGLEFPFVVVGLSGNPFPQIDEQLPPEEVPAALDAQRRLFYVGCSRAMRALMVSHPGLPNSSILDILAPPYWQKEVGS